MQKQICNYLNRPFPLFLAHRKGRIYFILMTFILAVLVNVLQPFGLINCHEFHKGLVLTDYIMMFFGIYALLYVILSYFRRQHYEPDTWTLRKEFQVLLLFLPSTACISCLFANFTIPEFDLTLDTFLDLQLYNGMLCVVSIPTFGYFIRTQIKTTPIPSEAKLNATDEEQARKILQKLHEVMETEQLYLSNKCNQKLVSEHTGIPVYRISGTINTFYKCSFTDFVNKYRVEHVCRILQDGKNKRLKLEAIGMECGFGGKVNFYAVFKKFTGKTPGEYLAGL